MKINKNNGNQGYIKLNEEFKYPSRINFSEDDEKQIMSCKDYEIVFDEKKISCKIRSSDANSYLYNSEKEYKFDNIIIKVKSGYCLHCIDYDGNELWKFRHHAWLYSEVERKGEYVIFATNGNGRRLYCLELETGKLVSEIQTVNGEDYQWINEELMVVHSKNDLLIYNPFTGMVVDSFKRPNKHQYNNLLKVIDNKIYTIYYSDGNRSTVYCLETLLLRGLPRMLMLMVLQKK